MRVNKVDRKLTCSTELTSLLDVLIQCVNTGLNDALLFNFCTAAKVNLNLAEKQETKVCWFNESLKGYKYIV